MSSISETVMEYLWFSSSATSYDGNSWSKIAIQLHLSVGCEMVGMIIKKSLSGAEQYLLEEMVGLNHAELLISLLRICMQGHQECTQSALSRYKNDLDTVPDSSGLLQESSGQFSCPASIGARWHGVFFRYRVLFNAGLMSLNVLKEEQLSHTLLYVEGKNVKAAFS